MSVSKYSKQLKRRDRNLHCICLCDKGLRDYKISKLVDRLEEHPDVVIEVCLCDNELTDITGARLACYLARSTKLVALIIDCNIFGQATYLAVAAALRNNTSLGMLAMYGNQDVDTELIDAAFVHALRLNPRPRVESSWQLYTEGEDGDLDYQRLKERADAMGHPTLQELLLGRYLFGCRELFLASRRLQ